MSVILDLIEYEYYVYSYSIKPKMTDSAHQLVIFFQIV